MHIDFQHCWTTLKSSPKIASIKTYFYDYCKPRFIRYNFHFIIYQINKLVHSDLFFMTRPYSHSCCYHTNTCSVRIHHDEAVVNFAKNFCIQKKSLQCNKLHSHCQHFPSALILLTTYMYDVGWNELGFPSGFDLANSCKENKRSISISNSRP